MASRSGNTQQRRGWGPRHPLVWAVTAAMISGPAWAQDSSGTQQLDTVEVGAESGSALGEGDFGYVGQRSLTATKIDTPVSETPRAISIVTREQMEDRASISIADALQYTPSIQANYFGEDNKQDWFVIRGFDQANNGLYRDGTRVYSYGFYSWQIDPFGLERVEILRGAPSALYGQNPPGGAINTVSKRPRSYSSGYVGLEYGSYDRKQLSVDVTGPVGDGHAYRLVALRRENETRVDDVDAERTLIAPSFKAALGENTDLTLLASYQKDDSDPYLQFLPTSGVITPNPNGEIDDDVAVGNPDYEKFEREQATLGYEFEHRFSDNTRFQQYTRYQHMKMDLRQMYSLGYMPNSGDSQLLRGLSDEEGDADGINVDNRLIHKWSFNGIDHTLLLGLDYQSLSIDGKSYGNPVMGYEAAPGFYTPAMLNPYDPRYRDAHSLVPLRCDFSTGACQLEADRQYREIDFYQAGAYLQDQMKFNDRFIFLFGVRFDHTTQEYKNKTLTTRQKTRNEEWTTSTGLAYLFDNGVTAYANYSQYFLPVRIEIAREGTNEAKPESGDNVELGLKYQPHGFDGYFNMALFQATKENMATGAALTLQQIGEVENKGVELEAVANITPSFSVIANATFMDPEIKENGNAAQEGNRPEQVAKTLASAWAKYSFLEGPMKGVSVGTGVRYVGDTYGDNDNTREHRVPSFTLWDATVSYQWRDWKFQVAAKNLADKEYVATCSGAYYCWYGDRRNVIGSVSYAW
ncbi:Ferric hydroxamate outer membrane receptor FhuA [Alloalcanivorax xenomutans]|jgi:iron complex outermembrane recepter protein|uniref:TonB-dependent siderophore receptor n=1 Tax=Alloalcanivorax xenomutans TaxID=1094342 RepID=UPI0006D5CEB8|nr:TonB-dependent siderophore receptor [Alloalcanivorax xenomutans]PHS56488.1 MAG: TonB-dependent siderophore receptor [Alcanivorax sp.]CUR44694.1 Ferric hydroxamate outer membrane receptor FhuA [Alloalcanivorax xenomutans]